MSAIQVGYSVPIRRTQQASVTRWTGSRVESARAVEKSCALRKRNLNLRRSSHATTSSVASKPNKIDPDLVIQPGVRFNVLPGVLQFPEFAARALRLQFQILSVRSNRW